MQLGRDTGDDCHMVDLDARDTLPPYALLVTAWSSCASASEIAAKPLNRFIYRKWAFPFLDRRRSGVLSTHLPVRSYQHVPAAIFAVLARHRAV